MAKVELDPARRRIDFEVLGMTDNGFDAYVDAMNGLLHRHRIFATAHAQALARPASGAWSGPLRLLRPTRNLHHAAQVCRANGVI